jgi:hypothetical protein
MKSFFTKVGRFFWSWVFLKFVLWVVTLIILFYVEEDWRGARAWAATKAEWEAKGESFDFNRLIPPPVPDDQNLAALPLFKMEPDPENKGNLAPLVLQRALRTNLPGNDLSIPHVGKWQANELPDMEKIREVVTTDYAEAFQSASPSNDALAQFDALYPFVGDLCSASATRSSCRFQHDYLSQPLLDDLLRMVTDQIQVAKILNLHAILALDAHKPDLALEDIKTNFKLISGLRQEPFLVSGLVAIGMTAINGKGAIYDGLAFHAWNNAQLADLQTELAQMNFLSDFQHDLRGEAIGIAIPSFDNLKSHRPVYISELNARNQSDESKLKASDKFRGVWSDGWIDLMKAQAVNVDLNAVRFVDPKVQMVFPKMVDQFAAEIAEQQNGWNGHTLWNILSDEAAGPISNAVLQFSEIQVWVDEARIACALERYRLAHGVYPALLDALAPACIDELPHDVMNGQPYHYQLRPDGTFLLYSVGWNQTDDGGKVVYKKDSPTQIDYHQGDWVWPTPK